MLSNFAVEIVILSILNILFCKPINSYFVNGEDLIEGNGWTPIFEPPSDIENETITKAFEEVLSVKLETETTDPSKQTSSGQVTNPNVQNIEVVFKETPLEPANDYDGFSRKRKPRNKDDDSFNKKNLRVRKEKANLKSKKVKLTDYTLLANEFANVKEKKIVKNFTMKKNTKVLKNKNKKYKPMKPLAINGNIKLKLKRTTNGFSIPIPEDTFNKNEDTYKVTSEVNTKLKSDTQNVMNLEEEKSTLHKEAFEVTGGVSTEPNTYLNKNMFAKEQSKLPQKFPTIDETYDFYYLNPHHIVNQLRFIAQQFSEDNITIEEEHLGKTDQYKDLMMLKVTENNNVNNKGGEVYVQNNYIARKEKKIIFIVHGLSVMNIRTLPCLAVSEAFEELIGFYFDHLDEFDIFLIPMANPDGVAVKKAFWNKNMSPQKSCPGVALDRNFEVSWRTRRNMSSCSQQYHGPYPFSEPETRAIRSVLLRYGHRIVAYLHLHAGQTTVKHPKGDAILYPKGYETQSMDEKYARLKDDLNDALFLHGTGTNIARITVDSLHKWHGTVAGSSVDYASSVYNIPVTLELVMRQYKHHKRDGIDESLTEVWAPALEAIFEFIKRSTDTQ